MNIPCIESFCPPQKKVQQKAALRQYTPPAQSPFWLLKPSSEHAHGCLLPRLSWSWTVLLPSNTHRKPITSIIAVLLPFVIYLLTLPRTSRFPWRCSWKLTLLSLLHRDDKEEAACIVCPILSACVTDQRGRVSREIRDDSKLLSGFSVAYKPKHRQ
jgi:hypothetical protein